MDNKEFIIYSPDGVPEVTVAFILCDGDKVSMKFEGRTTQLIAGLASLVHGFVKKVPKAKNMLSVALELAMIVDNDEEADDQ